MARYKDYNYEQSKPLPINFSEQILPGSFEYTFIINLSDVIQPLFLEVLMVCGNAGLIGEEMFAIDG